MLDESHTVDDLVSAVHLGLENERLHAQALTEYADLQNSGARIVAAGDEERRLLERDLHDGAQQRLVGLVLGLRLQTAQHPEQADLEAAEGEVRAAIAALRALGVRGHQVGDSRLTGGNPPSAVWRR